MIFAEALGLYGLIVAIVLNGSKLSTYTCDPASIVTPAHVVI